MIVSISGISGNSGMYVCVCMYACMCKNNIYETEKNKIKNHIININIIVFLF